MFYRLCHPHLILNSPAVFGVADYGQLQLSHLLHLPVHVDLLQQATDLAPQQTHRILLPLALGQQRGTGRVDGCHPVFQVSLVAGLKGKESQGFDGVARPVFNLASVFRDLTPEKVS